MRPMTRWLLVALVLVSALFATPKVHALWQGSQSLSNLAVSYGGERRTVALADGKAVEAVLSRKEKWCQCPGLGVIAQSPSGKGDSLFVLANALFREFQREVGHEPGKGRCLTVTLEVGDGMRGPWIDREVHSISMWRRSDQKWVLFRYDPTVPAETMRLLRASWPREGTL